jgi:hypothetical protein
MRFKSPAEALLGEYLEGRGGAADEKDDDGADYYDEHQDKDGVHLADKFRIFYYV